MTFGVNDYPHAGSCPGACNTQCSVGQCTAACCQCTAFACWRASNDLHFTLGAGYNDASTWANAARAQGVRVDNTPAFGCLFQLDPGVNGASSTGHVGACLGNNGDGTFTAEDYNWNPCQYSQHRLAIAGTNFLHLNDPSPSPSPSPTPNPCAGVRCGPCQTCSGGVCHSVCSGSEICLGGVCVPRSGIGPGLSGGSAGLEAFGFLVATGAVAGGLWYAFWRRPDLGAVASTRLNPTRATVLGPEGRGGTVRRAARPQPRSVVRAQTSNEPGGFSRRRQR